MAEKGILVTDQAGGESVALRDAFEQDNDSNNRVVQRIDNAVDHIISPMGAAQRTEMESSDNFNILAFPAQLTDNLITCGDKSKLIVCVEYMDAGNQSVDITPIAYDAEATPGVISVMESKTMDVGTNAFGREGSPGWGKRLAVMQSWDLCGATKIGLHCSAIAGGECGGSLPACVGFSVWGYVI